MHDPSQPPPDAGYQQPKPKTRQEQEWALAARECAERLNEEDIARGVASFIAWAHRRPQSRERRVSVCFWKNRAQRRAEAAQKRKAWKRIQREARKQVLRELRQGTLSQESDDNEPVS